MEDGIGNSRWSSGAGKGTSIRSWLLAFGKELMEVRSCVREVVIIITLLGIVTEVK